MSDDKIKVTPDCPNCGKGNTWAKHTLNRDYDHDEANAFCKNCRTEFYVPPKWFTDDDWEQHTEIFN